MVLGFFYRMVLQKQVLARQEYIITMNVQEPDSPERGTDSPEASPLAENAPQGTGSVDRSDGEEPPPQSSPVASNLPVASDTTTTVSGGAGGGADQGGAAGGGLRLRAQSLGAEVLALFLIFLQMSGYR